MDASRYKDYMLGLMFYKFLSDKTLATYKKMSGLGDTIDPLTKYTEDYAEYGQELEEMFQKILGYYIIPENLYQTWLKDIQIGDFALEKIQKSLSSFEKSIAVGEGSTDFKGLFSSSIIDLQNSALGSDLHKRSKNIKDLILLFSDVDMIDLQENDILGDAYE